MHYYIKWMVIFCTFSFYALTIPNSQPHTPVENNAMVQPVDITYQTHDGYEWRDFVWDATLMGLVGVLISIGIDAYGNWCGDTRIL